MNTSLSVLLPVYNCEEELVDQMDELLDVVAELTSDFDVLIIDDGSTDDTADVARDLARQYPQVNVVRHSRRRGLADAVQTGLKHSHGETVIVGNELRRFDAGSLRKLWPLRNDPDVVIARQPRRDNGNGLHWLQKLMGVREMPTADDRGELQLIRRQALRELQLQESPTKSRRLDTAAAAHEATHLRGPKFLASIKRFVLEE